MNKRSAILRRREERREYQYLYDSAAWAALRKRKLISKPYCERHAAQTPKKFVTATVVHHTVPHKGDVLIFFDFSLLQSLCKRCHDSDAQQEEKSGYHSASDDKGYPTDPKHPFNRRNDG